MYSDLASVLPGWSRGRWDSKRDTTFSLDSCCHWLTMATEGIRMNIRNMSRHYQKLNSSWSLPVPVASTFPIYYLASAPHRAASKAICLLLSLLSSKPCSDLQSTQAHGSSSCYIKAYYSFAASNCLLANTSLPPVNSFLPKGK